MPKKLVNFRLSEKSLAFLNSQDRPKTETVEEALLFYKGFLAHFGDFYHSVYTSGLEKGKKAVFTSEKALLYSKIVEHLALLSDKMDGKTLEIRIK